MKFNLRTGRMERDEMTMSPGTERAIFNLSQQMPQLERTLAALTKELKRMNDREENDRAEITARQEARDDGKEVPKV